MKDQLQLQRFVAKESIELEFQFSFPWHVLTLFLPRPLTPSLLPSAVRCCLPPPSPPSRQVLELGSALGLKEHSVRDGEGREVKLACPVESKGILGSDDRWGGRKGGGARKGTWGGGCGEEDVGR